MNFQTLMFEIYKEMRENGEPNDEITKALRNDDIESFQ